jgi:hypothetical protein
LTSRTHCRNCADEAPINKLGLVLRRRHGKLNWKHSYAAQLGPQWYEGGPGAHPHHHWTQSIYHQQMGWTYSLSTCLQVKLSGNGICAKAAFDPIAGTSFLELSPKVFAETADTNLE